jgi:hypothetical protein
MILTSIRFRPFGALFLLALLGSVAGCNDAPTTIGSEYLPEGVEFRSLTIGGESFSVSSGISTQSNNSNEGGTGVLVGRAADSTVAHGLLAFTTFSSTVTGSAAQPVTAASLTLRSYGYVYGDTAARTTAFDVVVIDGPMSQNAQYSDILASTIAAAPSIGTFSGVVPRDGAIEVTLDPAKTQDFLRSYLEIASDNSVTVKKHLALRASSDAGSITAFVGVTFLGLADSMKPTLNVTAGTTPVQLRAEVASWITKLPVDPGAGKFILAGGAPVRSYLRIRLDSLPANAVIHQAELTLHADTAASRGGSSGIPTFVIAYVADDSNAARNTLRTGNASYFSGTRSAADSLSFSPVIRFSNVGAVITAWARSRRVNDTSSSLIPNNGLILALNRITSLRDDQESASVDRLVFFGPDAADPSKRPTLKITYSILRADAQ